MSWAEAEVLRLIPREYVMPTVNRWACRGRILASARVTDE